MRRTAALLLSLTVALAGLTACGEPERDDAEAEYQAICVDEREVRVDDDECDEDRHTGYHGGHGWYYLALGYAIPGVGHRATGGTLRPRQGAHAVRGGAPRQGGKVTTKSFTRGGGTTTTGGGKSGGGTTTRNNGPRVGGGSGGGPRPAGGSRR